MQHNDEKHSIQRSQDITYFFFWKGKSRVKSWWWFNLSATSGCNFPVSIIAVVSFLESVILWGWELLLLGFWLQYFLWLEVMGNYLYGFYSFMDSYPLPSGATFFGGRGEKGDINIVFCRESQFFLVLPLLFVIWSLNYAICQWCWLSAKYHLFQEF